MTPLDEARQAQRRLASLANREARDLAKVRQRYADKRAELTAGLSPAAQRVLAAVEGEPERLVAGRMVIDDAAPEQVATVTGHVVATYEEATVAPPGDAVPEISPRLLEPIPPQPHGATKVIEDGKGGR